jgi:hypothetical protein
VAWRRLALRVYTLRSITHSQVREAFDHYQQAIALSPSHLPSITNLPTLLYKYRVPGLTPREQEELNLRYRCLAQELVAERLADSSCPDHHHDAPSVDPPCTGLVMCRGGSCGSTPLSDRSTASARAIHPFPSLVYIMYGPVIVLSPTPRPGCEAVELVRRWEATPSLHLTRVLPKGEAGRYGASAPGVLEGGDLRGFVLNPPDDAEWRHMRYLDKEVHIARFEGATVSGVRWTKPILSKYLTVCPATPSQNSGPGRALQMVDPPSS